jgi:hypothetical protein
VVALDICRRLGDRGGRVTYWWDTHALQQSNKISPLSTPAVSVMMPYAAPRTLFSGVAHSAPNPHPCRLDHDVAAGDDKAVYVECFCCLLH